MTSGFPDHDQDTRLLNKSNISRYALLVNIVGLVGFKLVGGKDFLLEIVGEYCQIYIYIYTLLYNFAFTSNLKTFRLKSFDPDHLNSSIL
jgi:hypothetical protein